MAEHGAEQLLYPGWLTGELFEYIDQMAAGKHLSGLYKGPRPDGYMAHFEKFVTANPGATLADFPQGLHPISGPGGRAHDDAVPLNIYRATAIPAFSENPDRALDLLEWWVSEEGQVARWFGIRGIHFTKDDFSDFNAEEFLKDQSWNPDVAGKTLAEVMVERPGDLMFLPGAATSNYDNGIVPFAETGSWSRPTSTSGTSAPSARTRRWRSPTVSSARRRSRPSGKAAAARHARDPSRRSGASSRPGTSSGTGSWPRAGKGGRSTWTW